jgi:hypothetical protein
MSIGRLGAEFEERVADYHSEFTVLYYYRLCLCFCSRTYQGLSSTCFINALSSLCIYYSQLIGPFCVYALCLVQRDQVRETVHTYLEL